VPHRSVEDPPTRVPLDRRLLCSKDRFLTDSADFGLRGGRR
jgi:hypothetical protein